MSQTGRMTLAEVASRLVVGLEGPEPAAREWAWLTTYQPAGVILFSRNVQDAGQVRRLCAGLRQAVPHLEIMVDHEGGPISHLTAAAGQPPSPWTLGALDDPDLTRRVHAATGHMLGDLGLTCVLGPCADVMTQARNPILGVRAFGGDQDLVARHVEAAVRGLGQADLAACLKHWPGHGASATDSHHEPARTDASHDQPFASGLRSGARAVMVGHLQTSAEDLPATLDAQKLERWRSQFAEWSGHEIQLWADDVTMGSLRPAMAQLGVEPPDDQSTGLVEPADLTWDWLRVLAEAGCDRLLIRGIPWQVLPLEESQSGGPPEGGPLMEDQAPSAVPPDIYSEVRSLWRDANLAAFVESCSSVLWLDFTATDRWDLAAGDQAAARWRFARQLAQRFRHVARGTSPEELTSTVPHDRLLVTSHRPLDRTLVERWIQPGRLASTGLAWAWGHPSLAADLLQCLDSCWIVRQCHEMDWGIFDSR